MFILFMFLYFYIDIKHITQLPYPPRGHTNKCTDRENTLLENKESES